MSPATNVNTSKLKATAANRFERDPSRGIKVNADPSADVIDVKLGIV